MLKFRFVAAAVLAASLLAAASQGRLAAGPIKVDDVSLKITSPTYDKDWNPPTFNPNVKFSANVEVSSTLETVDLNIVCEVYWSEWVEGYPGYWGLNQRVGTLINQVKGSGTTTFSIDLSELPDGVYTLKVYALYTSAPVQYQTVYAVRPLP